MKQNFLSVVAACLVVMLSFLSNFSYAQVTGVVRCWSSEFDSIRHANDPNLQSNEEFEAWMKKLIMQDKATPKPKLVINGVYQIPVIVHIIHNGEAVGTGTNLSAAVVQSQIDVLNEDFRRIFGTSGYNTHPDGADTQIEFCLAKRRPNGTAFPPGEDGINRINRNTQGWGAPPYTTAFVDGTIKPYTIATQGYDAAIYMNFWSVNLSGGILGYAQFPTTSLGGMSCAPQSVNTDGVVMLYSSIGKSSVTGQPGPYNEGRTATHEIGHWLGLRHIWGDGGCGVDDFCADTPLSDAANFGCPTTNSCTDPAPDPNDMVQNYMDYTDDLCMNIFTNDQKTRMRLVLENSPIRASLINSNACIPPAVSDASIVNIINPKGDNCPGSIVPTVTIKNRGSSNLTSATINYTIDNGPVTSMNWTGNIAPNAQLNVPVTAFSAPLGVRTIRAYTTLPNGVIDPNPAQDTTTLQFAISNGYQPNYTQDFEATTFVPDVRWAVDNPTNDCFEWIGQSCVSSTGVATNNAAMMPNFGNSSGLDDYLYTPIFILPCNATAASLRFNRAYRRRANGVNDRLRVEISEDCGATWNAVTLYDQNGTGLQTVTTVSNSYWIPSASTDWANVNLNLLSYVTGTSKNVQFRFRATNTGGSGGNIYIDDVQFLATTPAEIEVNVAGVDVLDGGLYNFGPVGVGGSTTATFTIQNTGTSNLILTGPISVTGTGFALGSTFGTTTVPAGGSTTFTVTFSPTAAGPFSGNVSFGTNDCDEGTYNFQLQGVGSVSPPVADFSGSPLVICAGSSVTFTNLSTNATTYSWSFPGGTPATSTATNPTIVYNTAGTYNVVLTATNAFGNDVETKNAYVTVNAATAGTAPPISEGFAGATFAPAGWSVVNGGTANTWVRVTTAGIAPTPGNAAQMDNFSGTNSSGAVDDLRMLPVNLTGLSSATLTFDVAYARYSAANSETLEVLVSNNCGGSFTTVFTKAGSTLATAPDQTTAFTPTAAQWRNETIDLTPYIGAQKVDIIFRNISGWGNNLYLDNINLTGVTSTATANFTAAPNPACTGQNVTFTNTSVGATSWNWNFGAGATPATATGAGPHVVTYATAGTKNVSLTVNGGASTSNQTVTVTAAPVAGTLSGTQNVCVGLTTTFASTQGGGTWSTSNGAIATVNASTGVVTGVAAGTATITYTVAGTGGCPNATATRTVTVTAAPNATISYGGSPYCGTILGNQTVSLSGTTGGTFSSTSGLSINTTTGAITPSASTTGTYTVTYTIAPSGGCPVYTTTTSVVIDGCPPTANDDVAGTALIEDGVNGTIGILGNDTDSDGTPAAPTNGVGQYSVDLDPSTPGVQTLFSDATGTWTYNVSTGFVTFDPANNYNGVATIAYELCDPQGGCDQATITFTVNPVNDPPVVDNEFNTTNEDTPTSGDLTDAGDSDVDGNLVVNTTPLSGPSNGTIVINTDGTFTYTPNPNFNGLDTVVVEICDDGTPLPAICVNDTIFITVNPVNDPPVVDNEFNTTNEDTPTSGDLTDAGDNDVDGNLVVNTTPIDGPNNGTIVINTDGTFTYTPNPNFNGLDTVVVEICDDGTPLPAICVNDTIFITVNPVNDPPVVDNEFNTTNEDTPTSGDLTDAGDSDIDGNLVVNTTPINGPNNGTIVINTDGTFTYTPNPNFNGLDTVVVEICDDGTPLPAICVNDTIFITVNPVNDPPVVDNEFNTTNEDTPTSGDLTDAGDSDVDGNLVVNTTPLSGPSNGTIVINTDGTFTYTPNPNFNGLDTVVVEICDDGTPLPAICVNDTIFITVNPVNDPPIVDNEFVSTTDLISVSGDLTDIGDFDPDGTALTAGTIVDGSIPGSIFSVNPDGTWNYIPLVGFSGIDTIVVEICDNGTPLPAACVNDTLFITVITNLPPVLDNEFNTTLEDTPTSGDLTDVGDSDPEGGNLVVTTTPVSGPTNGTIVINPDGTFTYTPNVNFVGNDTVIVQICDDNMPVAACANDTIFITINPVNDPPVVDNEFNTTNEDTPTSGDLTDAGDSDVDGNLVVNTTPISGPSNGTIVINTDGTFTYTPNPNFNGLDTVVVEICDDGTPLPAICVNDTIFITVNPVNDPPVVDNEFNTTNEDTPTSGDLTDAGDSDVDGNLVVNTTPLSGPSNGTIVINTDGTFTYTPNPNFNGLDTVVVEICDDGTPLPAICVNDTIFITVNPVNDPPVVDNEFNTTNEDTPTSGDLTDAGDFDIDGNLVVNTSPLSGPSNGTIVINTDGTFTYTPNPNFNGLDTVVVEICDDGTPLPAICVNDTIFITVNPVNDPPVVDNETHVTLIDTPVSGDLTDAGDSDVDGNLVVNTTPLSGPSNGTIVINPDGTYTYTPNPGYFGNDTVIVEICDDGTPLPAICVNDTIFITVLPCPSPIDSDGDGLTDCEETTGIDDPSTPLDPTTFAGGPFSDPNDPCDPIGINTTDTDGDGLTDCEETTGIDDPSTPAVPTGTSDPNDPCDPFGINTTDTDGDGLTDCEELTGLDDPSTPLVPNGTTDPLDPCDPIESSSLIDTDGDGLTDCEEITGNDNPNTPAVPNGTTDPFDPCDPIGLIATDTDGDGLTDCEELTGIDDPSTPAVPNGTTDPNDPCDPIGLITVDTDGDGLTDCEELTGIDDPSTPLDPTTFAGGPTSDPNDPCDPIGAVTTDSDGDGLTDCEELTGIDDPGTPNAPDGTSNPNDPCSPKPCGLEIPEGFTPDGDLVNDAFVIPGIEDYPGNELIVFNRWGNKVYTKSDYDNSWTGTMNVGIQLGENNQLPTGTYYYILDTKDETVGEKGVLQGFVYIRR